MKKMTIEQHKDVESGHENTHRDLQEPFIQHGKDATVDYDDIESNKRAENGSIGIVLLSTFVAVCGSFSFGTCVSFFWIFLKLWHFNFLSKYGA